MKVNVVTKTVTNSGEISSKKIKMSFNSKASQLIFGQIYPDIKKAVVRELFTNAWDSQKVAGNLQTPIEIHLPTKWEPHFSIRDYGVGMTPQVVDDVYSIVFESTKDQSNEEAGKWGMGSKSPWGYTDSFSLTSYVDGTFWYYELYMNEMNEPIIALKATGETEEPNGVEVSLGVLAEDFDVFKEHAERFALMANTPISINRQKFMAKNEVFQEGDGWQLYVKTAENTATQIRMGCVLYSINRNYLNTYLPWGQSELKNQFDKPFVLDFDIGEFDVTGSREDIIYNAESIKKLISRMEEAVAVLKERAAKDIQNSNSYFEAYGKLQNYKTSGFAPTKPKYGAFELNSYVTVRGLEFHRNPLVKKRVRAFEPSALSINNLYSETNKMNYFLIRKKGDDVVKNFNSRIENFIDKTQMSGLKYSRNSGYGGNSFDFYIVEYNELSDFKKLFVYLPPNAIFVNISDIDKKDRVKVDRAKKEAFHSKILRLYYGSLEFSYMPVEINKSDYYVTSEYSSFDEPKDVIKKALEFFKIDIEKTPVAILGKSQRHLIDKLQLVDLIQKYKDDTVNLRYNRDTMLRNVIYDFRYGSYNENHIMITTENFRKLKFPQFDYEEANVEEPFDRFINDEVLKEFNELKEQINLALDEFILSNPLYKFIEKNILVNNYEKIEKIIGELK